MGVVKICPPLIWTLCSLCYLKDYRPSICKWMAMIKMLNWACAIFSHLSHPFMPLRPMCSYTLTGLHSSVAILAHPMAIAMSGGIFRGGCNEVLSVRLESSPSALFSSYLPLIWCPQHYAQHTSGRSKLYKIFFPLPRSSLASAHMPIQAYAQARS